jgi:hypothetical protein
LCLAVHDEGMTDNSPRQPKGVPVGGQFAATTHSEPNVTLSTENAPRSGGLPPLPPRSGGLPPLPPRSGGSDGSGGLPPTGGSGGDGGYGDDDDEKRKESQEFVITAADQLRKPLVLAEAKTLSFAARDNGTLYVNGVANEYGYSVDDEYGRLADRVTSAINSQVKGGGGVPATHFLGNKKSVLVDVVALLNKGEIEFIRPTGLPPLH